MRPHHDAWVRGAVCVLAAAWSVAPAAQRNPAAAPRPDLVGRQVDVQVVRIADGDTIEAVVAGDTRPVRIRLHGVDAPELGESFSREAQAFLRALIFDRQVRLEGRDIDRYARLVARVTSGGKDASAELVRAGLACHAFARDEALARDEAAARDRGRGFWAATAKKPACVARTAFSARQAPRASPRPPAAAGPRLAAGYRGNTNAKVYHASWCRNSNCRSCSRLFTTEAEARAAGFAPAGDCLK